MFFPTNLPCVLLFFNWNPLSTTTEALVLAEAVAGGAYSAQELSKVSRLRLDNCAKRYKSEDDETDEDDVEISRVCFWVQISESDGGEGDEGEVYRIREGPVLHVGQVP